MRPLKFVLPAFALAVLAPCGWHDPLYAQTAHAQTASQDLCPRPAPGSTVAEPADLRSVRGQLTVHFTFRSEVDAAGLTRYCYVDQYGEESSTLRVYPGDFLNISLKNEIAGSEIPGAMTGMNHSETAHGCAGGGAMTAFATNLHFHGLAIPPKCHQDEVLTTSVLSSDTA